MDRYARQRVLDGFGDAGQERLADATVLVVGLGALGGPAALLLAGAGVGRLRIVDPDVVALHNLPRQTLYRDEDMGKSKATVAADRLQRHNPHAKIEAHARTFHEEDLEGTHGILDCTDDPGSRDWIHALAVQNRIPLAWGAVEGWDGQWATVVPDGPCLRCLWPSPGGAPSCTDVGILGPVSTVVAAQQALSILRVLVGFERGGTLNLLDGRSGSTETIRFPRRPGCAVCSTATK